MKGLFEQRATEAYIRTWAREGGRERQKARKQRQKNRPQGESPNRPKGSGPEAPKNMQEWKRKEQSSIKAG